MCAGGEPVVGTGGFGHGESRIDRHANATGRQEWQDVGCDRRRNVRHGVADADRPGEQRVLAPMPGRIVRVLVKPGDEVALRQGLVVVEAMKMENELKSPKAGKITELLAIEGAAVESGAKLAVVS